MKIGKKLLIILRDATTPTNIDRVLWLDVLHNLFLCNVVIIVIRFTGNPRVQRRDTLLKTMHHPTLIILVAINTSDLHLRVSRRDLDFAFPSSRLLNCNTSYLETWDDQCYVWMHTVLLVHWDKLELRSCTESQRICLLKPTHYCCPQLYKRWYRCVLWSDSSTIATIFNTRELHQNIQGGYFLCRKYFSLRLLLTDNCLHVFSFTCLYQVFISIRFNGMSGYKL